MNNDARVLLELSSDLAILESDRFRHYWTESGDVGFVVYDCEKKRMCEISTRAGWETATPWVDHPESWWCSPGWIIYFYSRPTVPRKETSVRIQTISGHTEQHFVQLQPVEELREGKREWWASFAQWIRETT